MADTIHINTDSLQQFASQLTQLSNQLDSLERQIRGLDLSSSGLREHEIRLSSPRLKLSDAKISSGTTEEVLADYAKAIDSLGKAVTDLRRRVNQAAQTFLDHEDIMVALVRDGEAPDVHRAAGESGDAQPLVVEQRVLFGAAKTISSTTMPVLSKKEAEDFLDQIFGEKAVRRTGFLWLGYTPHESLEDIYNILIGNTKGMTAEQIEGAKLDFVLSAYASLLQCEGGLMSAQEYQLHYNIMVSYAEKYCSNDYSGGLFGKFREQVLPGVTALQDGVSQGMAMVDLALAAPSIVAVGLETVTSAEARYILSELDKLNGRYDGLENVPGLSKDMLDMYADRNKYKGGITIKSDKKLTEFAEILHAIEASI